MLNETLSSYGIETDSDGNLFLAQRKDGTYKGHISYTFFKGKVASSRSFIGYLLASLSKKKKGEQIAISNNLPDSLAKDLMLKLQQMGIEQLIPCKDDIECKGINFFDPGYIVFNLTIQEKSKHLEYAAISHSKDQYPEKTQLRKKVQDLIAICYLISKG